MKADTCNDILCWMVEKWNDENMTEKLNPELINLMEVAIRKAYERSWLEKRDELLSQISAVHGAFAHKYHISITAVKMVINTL